MPSALINVPKKARRGDVIEIKTLMSHIMETGYRHTASGDVVPRDIITNFTCRFNGTEVFRADLFPAIAANPFITFFTTVTESGTFEFEWIGDKGFSETAVSVESPMTADAYVKSIHVFNEKNPQPNIGNFYLRPGAGRAQVSTRIRLADSQKVTAIARLSDDTFWSATADVVVTLAACTEEAI